MTYTDDGRKSGVTKCECDPNIPGVFLMLHSHKNKRSQPHPHMDVNQAQIKAQNTASDNEVRITTRLPDNHHATSQIRFIPYEPDFPMKMCIKVGNTTSSERNRKARYHR